MTPDEVKKEIIRKIDQSILTLTKEESAEVLDEVSNYCAIFKEAIDQEIENEND